jgi:hypothetical protein
MVHIKNKLNGIKKKQAKISRGYRLKPATHNRIKELSRSLELCSDLVLTRALRLLVKRINRK